MVYNPSARYVLSWESSTTMDAVFCVRALEQTLDLSWPEVYNAGQGSRFISKDVSCVNSF